MNAPVLLAQLLGITAPTDTPPRHIKLEKPISGATVTVHLDGPIQLDFTDIASDKLTFVQVGDKLIILFDNQSTVTIDSVFGPDGHPLAGIAFEMTPDHPLTGDQFASEFPITTDQSILPAAGAGDGPTSGGYFINPTVDALPTFTALDLLAAENNGSGIGGFTETTGRTFTESFIYNVATGGTETVTGGGSPGTETETINGASTAVTYNINEITLGAASDVGINIVAGTTAASDIAATSANYEVALHGVQELVINLGSAGDHVAVAGSLDGTGLATSTITINGGAGDDTVDLSKFTSGQDVVYNGAGNDAAGDTVIYGFAFSAATYAPLFDGSGHLIGASIVYASPNGDGPVTDTITNVEHFQFADQTLSVGQIFAPSAPAENVAILDTAGIDAGTITNGNALTGVTDVDSHTALSVTAVNGLAVDVGTPVVGQFGTLVLNANGTYTYTASAGLDALQGDQQGTDTFHFTVTDSNGGVTTTTLNFHATGAADIPVINAVQATVADTAAQDAGTVVLHGNLLTDGGDTDRDTGVTLTVTAFAGQAVTGHGLDVSMTYGTLHIDTDGSYTFTANAALDALPGGTVAGLLDTFTVSSSDGAVASSVANFTITGTADTPIITSGATGTEAEGTAASNVVYQTMATEADTGAQLSYTLDGADKNDFSVSSTGAVTFNSSPNFETQNVFHINLNVFNGTVEATEAVTVNVTDVAPVAVADSYSINEDTLLSVNAATGVLANDSDVNGGALTAVLVTGPANALSFTLNADGSFTYQAASNYNGTDSFTYEANDGTDNSTPVTVNLTINPVNDAPVLTAIAPQLTSVHTVNGGQTIASFLGTSISDVDGPGALQGIAITGTNVSNGSWQYSLNDGATWISFPNSLGNTKALLLSASDLVRFEPSGSHTGTDSLTYHAWDQTSGTDGGTVNLSTAGTGGSTAYSTAIDTATISVTNAANHAPALAAGSPTLTTITEDMTNPSGTTVATLLGSSVTDADPEALQGIAITAANSTHGTWEYSINGGASWSNLPTIGSGKGFLLAATDEVRYVPDAIDGSTDNFTFVAWDQTSGTHGTTATLTTSASGAFSTGSETASITVTAIDDAPVVHAPGSAIVVPEGDPIAITGVSVSDVDAGSAPIAVTLSVAHGTLSLANSTGLTFTDADGSDGSLTFTGSQTVINTALAAGIVYTSNATYLGSDAISVYVNDQGNTGAGGPLSGTGSAAISVVPPHHAPAGADHIVTINEDSSHTFAAADFGFTDPNDTPADTFTGVVITTLPAGGNLTDNGVAVTAGEVISVADINANDLVYAPAANANGAGYGTFTFQVQDNGLTYAPDNTDQSPNTMTINVTAVNDPPTISYAGPQSAPTNIVVNGGFETGDLTGWSTPGITIKVVSGGDQHSGSDAAQMYAFGPTTNELDQTLATVAGQTYTLEFWVSHATAVPSLSDSFTASWNGTQVVSLTGAAAEGNFGYTEFTATVAATSSSTVLDFTSFDTGYIWYLDDVSVTSTPDNIASVSEGTNLVFSTANGNAIQVADVDVNETPAPNNIMQVTLGVAHGIVTLSETAGISFISGANATGGMTIQGTLAALDSALNGLTYQADNYTGSDTLSISTNDLGHTGIGGPQTAGNSVAITVTPPPLVVNAVTATVADTAAQDAGAMVAHGNLITDVSDTGTGLTVTAIAGTPITGPGGQNISTAYGTLHVNPDGSYSFTASAGLDALQSGQSASVLETFVVSQSNGTSASSTLSLSFTGTADTPVVNSVQGGTIADTAAKDAGNVLASGNVFTGSGDSDRDSGATLAVSQVGGVSVVAGTGANVVSTYGTLHVDANGDYSFTASSGLDALLSGSTANLQFQFVVTSSDAATSSASLNFSITGATDTPIVTSATSGSEAENTATSNVVYQITATEADPGAHLTYSLSGTDAADFSVSSTGAVTFKSSPVYQTQSSYNINVNVFDGTLEASQAVAIKVTDVAPTNSVPGGVNILNGLSPVTYTFSVSDPNPVELFETLSVSPGSLTLASTTGLISVSGNGSNSITFEGTEAAVNAALNGFTYSPGADGVHHIVITSSDGTASSTSQIVTQVFGPAGVSGEPINLALADYSDHSGVVSLTLTGLAAGWALSEGSHNADGSWTVQTSDIASLSIISPDGYTGALLLHGTESWTDADGSIGTGIIADNVEAYAKGSPIFAWSGDDTLTASSGNDTLVFANQIGNDVVHDFDTAHDKIDLMGFNGFASFADVQAHLGNDAMGNAVITLGNGETITLNGVDAGTLGAGDFEFNQTPLTTIAGDMVIGDGATLPLSGFVDNTGSIHLNSAGNQTELEIVQHGVTLEGGGALVLSDSAENVILGSDPTVTFTNVDNTISGAGQLGDGQMTLVNEGTVVADGTNSLVIDTGSNAIINSGTLEALGLGGLAVHSDLVNEGVLWANGSSLTLGGDVGSSGSARISGNGDLEIGGLFGEQVQFDDNASGTLKIDHAADFTGILSGFGGHDAIDLGDILAATASVTYTANTDNTGGVLTVSDGGNTANIAMIGHYTSADFQVATDPTNHALVQIEQHAHQIAAAA
jgi:VCBS repeat-containing protein